MAYEIYEAEVDLVFYIKRNEILKLESNVPIPRYSIVIRFQ